MVLSETFKHLSKQEMTRLEQTFKVPDQANKKLQYIVQQEDEFLRDTAKSVNDNNQTPAMIIFQSDNCQDAQVEYIKKRGGDSLQLTSHLQDNQQMSEADKLFCSGNENAIMEYIYLRSGQSLKKTMHDRNNKNQLSEAEEILNTDNEKIIRMYFATIWATEPFNKNSSQVFDALTKGSTAQVLRCANKLGVTSVKEKLRQLPHNFDTEYHSLMINLDPNKPNTLMTLFQKKPQQCLDLIFHDIFISSSDRHTLLEKIYKHFADTTSIKNKKTLLDDEPLRSTISMLTAVNLYHETNIEYRHEIDKSKIPKITNDKIILDKLARRLENVTDRSSEDFSIAQLLLAKIKYDQNDHDWQHCLRLAHFDGKIHDLESNENIYGKDFVQHLFQFNNQLVMAHKDVADILWEQARQDVTPFNN